MSDSEFLDLIRDVQVNGLVEPIVLHEGRLVDGRHRLQACLQAGVQPTTIQWTERYSGPMDLTSWIWSVNAQRRSLTPEERAAAYLAINGVKDREQAARAQTSGRKHGGEATGERRGKAEGLLTNSPASSDGGERDNAPVECESSNAPKAHSTGRRKKVGGNANVSQHVAKKLLMIENHRPDLLEAISQRRMSPDEALALCRSHGSNCQALADARASDCARRMARVGLSS